MLILDDKYARKTRKPELGGLVAAGTEIRIQIFSATTCGATTINASTNQRIESCYSPIYKEYSLESK